MLNQRRKQQLAPVNPQHSLPQQVLKNFIGQPPALQGEAEDSHQFLSINVFQNHNLLNDCARSRALRQLSHNSVQDGIAASKCATIHQLQRAYLLSQNDGPLSENKQS